MPATGPVRLGRVKGERAAPSNQELIQYPRMSSASLLSLVREKRLRSVLQRIETGTPQSVNELARAVSLSPAYLQRLFKQETGVHISDLLSEHRLLNAAHLLATTDMEVKEIAYTTGYQHHSSFGRAFQRRFGRSPRQYRQPEV